MHDATAAAGPRYAELHCRSNYSFLEGGSHPEELVQQAQALGYEAIAITDRSTLAGIVRAHGAVRRIAADTEAAGGAPAIRLVIGAHLDPVDAMPLVVWATNRTGYSHLCRLLTHGYAVAAADGGDEGVAADGRAGACLVSLADVAAHAEGLLAGVPLAAVATAGMRDADGQRAAVAAVLRWREVFGERLVALAEVAVEGDDAERLRWFAGLGRATRVPLVAAGDVRYHERARLPLFDALTAVRHGCTVEEVRGRLLHNGERHLHDRRRVAARFASLPGAVERSVELANRCTFSLADLRYEYPDADVPAGCTPAAHLARLVWRGAAQRYPDGIPDRVRALIAHELALVTDLGYEAYFLTVFDLVRFARRRGILCQGRGSAANSAICYCLGITSVDPARMDVLFERFISRERCEAPDIDIDFEHNRREEVIQYVYETYGRSRAAMTAEVICYRLRSATRDIGKVLGLSLDRVDAIADVLDAGDGVGQLPQRLAEAGLDPADDVCTRLTTLVGQLVGFPRHLGQHVGGMVMTRASSGGLRCDLCDLVPIQPAAMAGRTVIQWDKNDLDELGILKVDCLALGMLSCIHRAFDLIESSGGPRLTLATVPAEDRSVYEMISRADTVGVFQIESRAQMSMLPRLKPACFYDLVIEVAIVRPGPIQGDMVHPYLRRRAGEEPVTFPNDAIRQVLEKTLGVPLFQEQAMRLAVVAAGFTPGEADQLRRAMGAWRRPGVIDEFHRRLVEGMLARGLSRTFAEQVFQQIRGFGEYGFPESHAASFALLVYVSAWLKRHHPAAFTAALLGSQPMGFYAPAQLVRDARDHGVRVLPADVNASAWHATVEGGSLGLERRRAVWEAMRCLDRPEGRPLLRDLEDDDEADATDDGPVLPDMTRQEEVAADYRTAGLSLRSHPLRFHRDALVERGVLTARAAGAAPEGRRVQVAGIVLTKQRPATASGMIFLTIEDETGAANVVVRPDVWQAADHAARRAAVLVVQGRIQRRGTVVHVLATGLEPFSDAAVPRMSRDFR
ncbi:MAG: DNA polymerase III subunit alpha [Planctomycetia bacterium]|nr:DNA polymerase III subunit alpha [Planctomycetia bacterium]